MWRGCGGAAVCRGYSASGTDGKIVESAVPGCSLEELSVLYQKDGGNNSDNKDRYTTKNKWFFMLGRAFGGSNNSRRSRDGHGNSGQFHIIHSRVFANLLSMDVLRLWR